MLETKKDITNWLNKYNVTQYCINEDLTVDVNNSVFLSNKEIKEIPFFFNEVHGDFDISNNFLTSLKGCPKIVGQDFLVYDNSLSHLNDSPLIVKRLYLANNNPIMNIDGINEVGTCISLKNTLLFQLNHFNGCFGEEIYISGPKYENGEFFYIKNFEQFYQDGLLKMDYDTLMNQLLHNMLENNTPIKDIKMKKKI